MKKITLHNVLDIRTDKFHSIVIVKENQAKWFVPAEVEEEKEPEPEAVAEETTEDDNLLAEPEEQGSDPETV